ncbi:MAG: DUF1697 domain-containing protein [Acidobacteriota bacterium]
MPKYIAFLRAINVGGHTVKMDALRLLFEEMEFSNVETFIASGNVIFDSPGKHPQPLEQKIEKHLKEKLGYAVATFIRSTVELATIAQYQPFSDAELSGEGHGIYIAFLPDEPTGEAQQKMLSMQTTVDAFHFHQREMYWLCRTRFSESLFKGNMEKILGMSATMRNSTTVKKLVAKYS